MYKKIIIETYYNYVYINFNYYYYKFKINIIKQNYIIYSFKLNKKYSNYYLSLYLFIFAYNYIIKIIKFVRVKTKNVYL
jgi:hypothetical protein